MKVLIAQIEGKLSETERGFRAFEYELFSKIAEEGIECYITFIDPPKENFKNIHPLKVKKFSALEIYRVSKELLHDNKVDTIHHFRFLPHYFNLLAIFQSWISIYMWSCPKPLINVDFALLKELKTISPAINLLVAKTLHFVFMIIKIF